MTTITPRTMDNVQIRARYQGAWNACDRDYAHTLCVEMRRRGMPVPSWPGIHQMTEELAAATPTGVMLLAVIRVAGEYAGFDEVRRAVLLTYPLDESGARRKELESDIIHARASGLIVEDLVRKTWTLAAGPRVDALVGTMTDDGPHLTFAKRAWEVVFR